MLYLRSFAAEDQATLWRPKRRKGLASFLVAVGRYLASQVAPQAQSTYLTLEQYISRHVAAWIGPLVALGNPEDRLSPEGAARAYMPDIGWMPYFISQALAAKAIIIEPSTTPGLAWEMRSLREQGLATKVFVILEPRRTVPLGLRSYSRLNWWLRGWRWPSWPVVADQLRGAGYIPPDNDPGPGSVLGFDEHGRAIVLTAGARSPDALVRPVRHSLHLNGTEVAVPNRPLRVLREVSIVLAMLIACNFAAFGARSLFLQGSSVTPAAAGAATVGLAPDSPAPTADPSAAEASQLAAIGELVKKSVQVRSIVVAAVGMIQKCSDTDSVNQAVQELQQAAAVRQDMTSGLTQLPAGQIPYGEQLKTNLAAAFSASAQADLYYATWGNDSVQNGACDARDQSYQAALSADSEAVNAKTNFAEIWDQVVPQFGLPQLDQSQF